MTHFSVVDMTLQSISNMLGAIAENKDELQKSVYRLSKIKSMIRKWQKASKYLNDYRAVLKLPPINQV